MTDADIDTMRKLVPEDMTFIHMSGRQQTREEYFADVENGSLRYFTIGIDTPKHCFCYLYLGIEHQCLQRKGNLSHGWDTLVKKTRG